jgi:sporulation protein YabP
MAGRQKEIDRPDRTVRAKKTFGTISILICIFVAALVIDGVFWITGRNLNIPDADEALSGLKTAAYSAEKADGGSDDSNKHGIVLENRKNMTLTGVEEVSDFDERKIVLVTELGQLTITGRSLRILYFKTDIGDLRVDGTIDSLVYADKKKNKIDIFGRIKE